MYTLKQSQTPTCLKYPPVVVLDGLKYLPLAFGPTNGCKINVFTANIMVLHHKRSQVIKKKNK